MPKYIILEYIEGKGGGGKCGYHSDGRYRANVFPGRQHLKCTNNGQLGRLIYAVDQKLITLKINHI